MNPIPRVCEWPDARVQRIIAIGKNTMKVKPKMTTSFEEVYPNIVHFVDAIGYIAIGHDSDSPLTSFIQAMDPGGMVWEGKEAYKTLDEALQDLDDGLKRWMREVGIE